MPAIGNPSRDGGCSVSVGLSRCMPDWPRRFFRWCFSNNPSRGLFHSFPFVCSNYWPFLRFSMFCRFGSASRTGRSQLGVFFLRKEIPVDARTTITKNRLLGGFVLGWNGRRIVVPKELPGIDILIGDISAQITSANKEPHAEAAAPDPHGESADGAKEPAP